MNTSPKVPLCPKCRKNPCQYNKEQNLWEYCPECTIRKKQENIDEVLVDCGIPKRYTKYSLDNFITEKVNRLREESDNWTKNIIFTGDSFVGKTVFLSGICKELLLRTTKSILFINCFDVFSTAKNEEVLWESAHRASTVDILILDDLIKPVKDWEYTWLYTVLNERMQNVKTVHASTNLEDLEANLDARLYSRLVNEGYCIELTKNSWKGNYENM